MSHPGGTLPGGILEGGPGQGMGPIFLPPVTPPTPPPIVPPVAPSALIAGTAGAISKTRILNLALIDLGISKLVANLDTEASKEAILGRLIFPVEVDYVLRDFPWNFAKRYAKPGLVAGSPTTPANRHWAFAYRYPSDCLFVRSVISPMGRQATTPIPFAMGSDAEGELIFTDLPEAEIEYTANVTDPERWDAMFVQALHWRLAAHLAPALTRVEGLARSALQMYELEKSRSERAALNEQQLDPEPESEYIRARG
jgi:hypothetical protein